MRYSGNQEKVFRSSLLSYHVEFSGAPFVSSLVSLFRSFVGSHISAFNFCKSQFRERVSQSTISLKGYGRFRAYPCVDERAFAISAFEDFSFDCGSR